MIETITTALVLARATHTMEVAVKALAMTLGQKWSGVDVANNLRL
jgi:hypothetical protein